MLDLLARLPAIVVDLLLAVVDRLIAIPVKAWLFVLVVGAACVVVGSWSILWHRRTTARAATADRQIPHGGRLTHPEFDLELANDLETAASHFHAWQNELDDAAGRADKARRRRMERQRS